MGGAFEGFWASRPRPGNADLGSLRLLTSRLKPVRSTCVDLPAHASYITCARTATTAFPSTTAPRKSNQACLWVRLRVVRVKVTVPRRDGGRRIAEAGNNLKRRRKNAVTKPYLNGTASFYAGTSEKVRPLGQIYASCSFYSWQT